MTARNDALARPRAWRFANGEGRYVADLGTAGMLHAAFVRSTQAHADILSINCDAASRVPGVRLVLTGADYLPFSDAPPIIWDVAGQRRSGKRALAAGRVRHVGEAVAVVVADRIETAREAAALVTIAYAARPVVVSMEQALHPDAPLLYDDWPDNVVAQGHWEAGDVASAFAGAETIVKGSYISSRLIPLSLEGRAVIAAFEPSRDGVTVTTSTQAPHQVREAIASCLRVPEHAIRVVVPDVGGAFGLKSCAYGEEVLLAHLALRLRATVRWIERREEAFVGSVHGRDEQVDLELALARDGAILGLCAGILQDKGSEPYATSVGAAWAGAMLMSSLYRIPNIRIDARVVVTNKTPTGAYRGYGVPEVNFALERGLDEAARVLGMDPAEIRRRNFVPPKAMPYMAPQGLVLDSGRYADMLDLALAGFDWAGERQAAAQARAEGRKVGVGLSAYAEPTNMGPSKLCGMIGINAGGFDVANVRMEPSGHIVVFTGQTPMGQGVEASLARICAEELTVPVEDVTIVHGDTQSCAYTGYGSGGSRGTGVGGSSVMLAAGKVRQKLIRIAAHMLNRPADTLILSQGGVQVADDPGQRVPISAIARAAYHAHDLPDGVEPGIEERATFDPQSLAITYGVALVRLEVDPETGVVDVQRILFGHDCGRQISPALVEGQVVGGIAQGIGAALYEEFPYDADGRPLTTSMRDYELVQALDIPDIELVHLETPSPFFPNGAKGVGESGVIPTPAAIANALRDALGSDAPPDIFNRVPVRAERLIAPELLTRFSTNPEEPKE
ncbi:xanthine dehydrogenase family protein molybdopterin-binding subunit [Sphingosinicella rhizophila]|uniref:Xanthine dehydrogenase family protein molybdopterin-binding subunit n=1 Tax=Sphingosinicella rhizophila TaxID=3050082 RepID=A0ABU3Q5W8_9SPHN|nr:xanthine dehydrogenase family protein molybdopterin-binding subunit [Sphingosinicella sp. GR2756]MDT9598796.1 xanthine dehydrogenase family protein molybdopterin-binding subunit [Sphingosinicella sp. GR2756]